MYTCNVQEAGFENSSNLERVPDHRGFGLERSHCTDCGSQRNISIHSLCHVTHRECGLCDLRGTLHAQSVSNI